jgi:hypothetical protein
MQIWKTQFRLRSLRSGELSSIVFAHSGRPLAAWKEPKPARERFARYTSFGFLHIIPTRPIDGWNGDSNLPTKTFRQTSGADEVQ